MDMDTIMMSIRISFNIQLHLTHLINQDMNLNSHRIFQIKFEMNIHQRLNVQKEHLIKDTGFNCGNLPNHETKFITYFVVLTESDSPDLTVD